MLDDTSVLWRPLAHVMPEAERERPRCDEVAAQVTSVLGGCVEAVATGPGHLAAALWTKGELSAVVPRGDLVGRRAGDDAALAAGLGVTHAGRQTATSPPVARRKQIGGRATCMAVPAGPLEISGRAWPGLRSVRNSLAGWALADFGREGWNRECRAEAPPSGLCPFIAYRTGRAGSRAAQDHGRPGQAGVGTSASWTLTASRAAWMFSTEFA
jgi:hypothetical protein